MLAQRLLLGLSLSVACSLAPQVAIANQWKAGAAKVAITPAEPMWMSGYAARTRPADGKVHELWAKALVLEDGRGERGVLITLDLVGIDRAFSADVCQRIEAAHQLHRARIALLSSHTHSGPVVGHTLMSMYFLDDEQTQLVEKYTAALASQLVDLVGQAMAALAPAEILWGEGTADFAVNRRNNPEAEVPRLRAEGGLKGPSDHTVPVLAVRGLDGALRAVLFGYACHATVLDGYQWCGDYPGFAQAYLEQEHAGAVALFFAGCGGDQNPIPRRQLEFADRYGRQLASTVSAVLTGEMRPVQGALEARYEEIELPFASIPNREQLLAASTSDNRYEASRARGLLVQLEKSKVLAQTYPYPIAAWRLGSGPLMVMLGGEVVVDYALRLRNDLLPAQPVWCVGYANDVMAYIPSRRVLDEGGYEGGGAMVYYGLPSAWGDDVEERIIAAVRKQVELLSKNERASRD